jgi:serralysin
MSYFTPEEAGQADWRASDGKMYYCQTPMMNDIAAIQAIYGKKATRESDTVYGFNASSGLSGVYNFNINKHPVLCIYDTGGIDTLNLTGFSSNSSVNLQPGTFSSCDMMTKNISIARDVIIENARTGSGNDRISGNDVANVLHGGAGNDRLFGGLGNDTLNGGSGADRLSGGAGDDIFFVDNGKDQIVENASQGNDTVSASVTVTALVIGSHVENIRLIGTTAISATGNDLANTITGNAKANSLMGAAGDDILNGGRGNDRLFGGTENDTLNGGSGNDTLSGGVGADIFVFSTALGRSNIDTIRDFRAQDDTIHLEGDIFKMLPTNLSDTFGTLLIYNSSTGGLLYDADGTGSIAAVQFAILSKNLTLTADHFVII